MKIYSRPDQKVLAESAHSGELADFPDIARGWGKSLDLTGGIPPMEWFNALGKRTDEAIRYLSQRGISEWSADESYPQGAVSYFNQQLWFASKNNHNQSPKQGTVWQRISFTEEQIKQLIPVTKVNGKTGNVELTVADIKNAVSQSSKRLQGSQDFDTIIESGFYQLYDSQHGSKNSPPFNYGTMIVTGRPSSDDDQFTFISQLAINKENNDIYIRCRNDVGKQWIGWSKIPTEQQIKQLQSEQKNCAKEYRSVIDLTGLSTDRYYPVWWAWPRNSEANTQLTIFRNFDDDGHLRPFGADVTHVASLYLELEGNDIPWGGAAQYLNIKRLQQRYHKSVKKINHAMMAIARPFDGSLPMLNGYKSGETVSCLVVSGLYLKGGLNYKVAHNFNSPINYSRSDEEVYVNHVKADGEWEIQWNVKSYHKDDPLLGEEYKDYTNAYQYDLEASNYFPTGIPQPWPSATPPTGWLKCDGASFNKNHYPLLAKAYPSGVLPDLRGEFIRGWDDNRGVDSGRALLSFQAQDVQSHTHPNWLSNLLNAPGGGNCNFVGDHLGSNVSGNTSRPIPANQGVETRPRNIAFLYIVRAA